MPSATVCTSLHYNSVYITTLQQCVHHYITTVCTSLHYNSVYITTLQQCVHHYITTVCTSLHYNSVYIITLQQCVHHYITTVCTSLHAKLVAVDCVEMYRPLSILLRHCYHQNWPTLFRRWSSYRRVDRNEACVLRSEANWRIWRMWLVWPT
jgi:hypothetical protein